MARLTFKREGFKYRVFDDDPRNPLPMIGIGWVSNVAPTNAGAQWRARAAVAEGLTTLPELHETRKAAAEALRAFWVARDYQYIHRPRRVSI